ncbi:hypothetical protein AGDE_12592 [Angomonas deanei]|uniref:Uncharacterized protein n=1 Tax=Angomonas deanei TaxID=59799 RepID=A0A7G2CB66_9TRYP|nr:hypothetical protein AGDE_12592 [Angomonas deanei]CAD2217046.1 hypothetical protein, conserved [Angomonas deanei]|eukprot:EPY24142.1 hypothetical protein AGDE_12592 [Angomonas deanei]
MSFTDPTNLRWALYDGVYYPALLLPSEADTADGHVNVFFLGFDSGASVPTENVRAFDLNDSEKVNNVDIQPGIEAAKNILANASSFTENGGNDIVFENPDDGEERRRKSEKEKKKKKKKRDRESDDEDLEQLLEDDDGLHSDKEKSARHKKKKEKRSKRHRDTEEDDDDAFGGRVKSSPSGDKVVEEDWFNTDDYVDSGKGGGLSQGNGRRFAQRYVQQITYFYEVVRQRAREWDQLLSLSERSAVNYLEEYLERIEITRQLLEAQIANAKDEAEVQVLKEKLHEYSNVVIETLVHRVVLLKEKQKEAREIKKAARFTVSFRDLSIAFLLEKAREYPSLDASDKLQRYYEQEQRAELFLTRLRNTSKAGIAGENPKPFQQWNQTRDLMILSGVRDTQPVPCPGFIPRSFSQAVKNRENEAVKRYAAANQQTGVDEESQLQNFQSYKELTSRKYPVYFNFNDLTIDAGDVPSEDDNVFDAEAVDEAGGVDLPSIHVGINLESEVLQNEGAMLRNDGYQSVVPEYSVGLESESAWLGNSLHKGDVSISASSAHSGGSRFSLRKDNSGTSNWREAVKRCVSKRLYYYATKKGDETSLTEDQLPSVAKKLVDRTTRKMLEGGEGALLLRTNDQMLVFDKDMEKRLIKSVDSYVQRHFLKKQDA